MCKYKRIILIVCIIICFFGLIFYSVIHNLNSNSVYYAKHVENKYGRKPVVEMLLLNINWIDLPKIDGFEYYLSSEESSGLDGVCNTNINTGYRFPKIYDSTDDGCSIEFVYKDNMSSQFGLDENFKIIWVNSPFEPFDKDSINHDEVRKEIYEMLAPVIDNISEPTINLQSLFNFLNKDKYRPID